MGYAVVDKGLYHRVARYDLAVALGGRVAVVGRLDVGVQRASYLRQPPHELQRYRFGLVGASPGAWFARLGACEAQPGHYLVGEELVQTLYVDAYMIAYCAGIDGGLAEVSWENDGT